MMLTLLIVKSNPSVYKSLMKQDSPTFNNLTSSSQDPANFEDIDGVTTTGISDLMKFNC